MAQEVAEPSSAASEDASQTPAPTAEEPAPVEAAEAETEQIEIEEAAEPEAAEIPIEIQEITAEPAAEEPVLEIVEEPVEETSPVEAAADRGKEFELELSAGPAEAAEKQGAATTEDFLSELAAEIDDMETPPAKPAKAAKTPAAPVNGGHPPAPARPAAAAPVAKIPIVPAAPLAPVFAEVGSVPPATIESLNELAEVFQEFRSELGEMADEDEDLETHYNLGIAYREMGLLDEAIGEFQKVAKAVQKGKPFPYAMNCATLLALSFVDKGEPKIASLWYQRALETPRLDQETVMALRYDLGVALDLAGESSAALDSFRQVYAMNIDYRDVADRIATLQKA